MALTHSAFGIHPGPRDNLEDVARWMELALQIVRKLGASVHLICDGVGGQKHGRVASTIAADCILSYVVNRIMSGPLGRDSPSPAPDDVVDLLTEALHHANNAILRQTEDEPVLEGMATTAVCSLVLFGSLYVVWAGDSRCYLHSRGRTEQLTHDHTKVQELVDAGVVEEKDARCHPLGHTVTQYLGKSRGLACGTAIRRLDPGDVVLLCTDGLTDVVDKSQIAATITTWQSGQCDFSEVPGRLIQQALSEGTTDNVTVLCCEYQPENQVLARTLTGAYPVVAARAIHSLLGDR